MPINNVYDIYNATLGDDDSYVDAIMAQIKTDLETNIAANISKFDVDLVTHIGPLPAVQKNRIIDRVLFECRNAGIRCRIKNTTTGTTAEDIYYSRPFNTINGEVTTLVITWYTRNNQEYMKTYF